MLADQLTSESAARTWGIVSKARIMPEIFLSHAKTVVYVFTSLGIRINSFFSFSALSIYAYVCVFVCVLVYEYIYQNGCLVLIRGWDQK